jgi:phage terminase large subunit-like protein
LRAVLGPEPEALILVARGAGKSTLMGLVCVHHLLTVADAKVYVAASSRDQARILFEAAEHFARELADPRLVFRHLELRYCEDPDEPTVFTRHFRVLPAEGPRLHGLDPTLLVWDEAQAVVREDVYPALASSLHKTPGAKLVTISTAGMRHSPLERIRTRALALPDVKRRAHDGARR